MNFLLFGSVADVVGDVFNIIWSQLNLIIYGLIVVIFRLFTNLSQLDILSADQTNGIYQRVTMVITIVMVFYITFEFVKYVVQPDTISDKEKGVGKIGMRIVIAILLIAFIPTIFNLGMRLQNKILSTNVISKVILGQDSFDFKDAGSNFAGDVFSAFYRVDYSKCGSLEECQKAQNKVDEVIKLFKEDKGTIALESAMISSLFDVDDTIQYDGLLAVVFGAFILYVVFLYCIDLGVRYIQLIFLQIIAPIAAISYIVPQKDGMFQKWTKQVTTTYLDVFIRVAILYFMLLIVSILSNSLDFFEMSKNGTQINIFEYLFVIAGLLIFVQRAPKLLEELLPFKGGAASIGFGFSGKSRFEPIGKSIGTMAKPFAAATGIATGVGKTVGAMKKRTLLSEALKGEKGKGIKGGLKKGREYATTMIKAAGRGAAAGAKGGIKGFGAARLAAQESVQKDEKIVDAGGTVYGSTFKGAQYQDKKAKLQLKVDYLEEMNKRKKNLSEATGDLKLSKQLSSIGETITASGDTAAIVAFEKTKKDIDKAQRIFAATDRSQTDFNNYKAQVETILKEFQTKTNVTTTTVQNNVQVPVTTNSFMSDNTIANLTTSNNLEEGSVKYENISISLSEAFKVATEINGTVYGEKEDPNDPRKTIETKITVDENNLKKFADEIGDITDQANMAANKIKASSEYKEAKTNASETKGSN